VNRALILALALFVAAPANADRTVAQPLTACGLSGTTTSIVADIYNALAAATLLATVPNGSFTRVSGAGDCYEFNLAAASGIAYPAAADAAEKHYVVKFRDNQANEVWATASVSGVAGSSGDVPDRCEKPTFIYANSPIGARGLTQSLINEGFPSYTRVEVACDGDFATPDATYYLIRYYDSTGRDYYTLPSSTVPNP
jgi:hypothetical protein